jgi:methylglyoxal synthase
MASPQRALRCLSAVPFFALVPTLALAACALAACGDDAENVALPIFEGGLTIPNENDGGEASTDGGDAAIVTDGEVTDTSTTDGTTNDGATAATNLVISQVQSRGTGGGNDEFIEIYNPTADAITFDATWSITDRNATSGLGSCSTAASTLYTGTGQVIASHKHLLLTTSSYSGSVVGDDMYSANISDAASLVLVHASATVDALCFSYDVTTQLTLTTCTTPYVCEGLPATNPHDNTTGTDTNASLERKPGGTGGNGIDSNQNSNDFASVAADDPHDLASAAVP